MKRAAETLEVGSLRRFSTEGVNVVSIYEAPRLRVFLVCLEQGQEVPPHNGPCDLLIYGVEGSGRITVGEEEVAAQAGDVLVVPGHVVRGLHARTRFTALCATNNCGDCELDRPS